MQHWTKLVKSGPWPEERFHQAACCLNFDREHPQLLVTGGQNRQNKALEDIWILDVDLRRWRKVRKAYFRHSLSPHFGVTMVV